jgi:hypothetical protein
MIKKKYLKRLRVVPGKNVSLKNFGTGWAQDEELKDAGKEAVKERSEEILRANREALAESQELLWRATPMRCLSSFRGWTLREKTGPSGT